MSRPSRVPALQTTIGIALTLLGAVLVGWSAWLYHFAAAGETDEPRTFWIATGSLVLVLGAVTLVAARRHLRDGRTRR
jgi:hypothetical protein